MLNMKATAGENCQELGVSNSSSRGAGHGASGNYAGDFEKVQIMHLRARPGEKISRTQQTFGCLAPERDLLAAVSRRLT